MNTDQMIAAVAQVRWDRMLAWPYSIEFLCGQWHAAFREYDCRLSVNDHRTYLHYPASSTIRPLLLATADDLFHIHANWSSDGLAPAEWPDSVWVLLDAILSETLEMARHPTILAPLCESILKTRMTVEK